MGNLNMEARQIHYRHDDTMTVDNKLLNLEGRVSTLEDGEPAEVSKVDIAPVFSAETAYSAGDYVYHEGHLYKFTADHAAGTWSDLDTESAVVTSDLAELQSDLTTKQDATDNTLQTTDKTVVGAVNELKSGLTNYENQNDLNLEVPDRKNIAYLSSFTNENNITFTADNSTGTVNASGTPLYSGWAAGACFIKQLPAGKYIVSCATNPNDLNVLIGMSSQGVITLNGIEITVNSGDTVQLAWSLTSGQSVNYVATGIMIRPARITDATFAPYVPSVESRLEAVESGLDTVQSGLTSLDYVKDRVLTGGRNASAGDVVFNMSARGAGIALVSQNGVDSTIILLTMHSNGTFTAQKLIGQDVTIDYSDISAVKFALVAWSKITIYTNGSWTKVS